MIPQIKETLVDKKGWISDNDMLELLAICESTPGPVAINMATYIGYKRKKFFGALLCTFGVVLPSFGIIILVEIYIIYKLIFKKKMNAILLILISVLVGIGVNLIYLI